jgi:hypothetical protein
VLAVKDREDRVRFEGLHTVMDIERPARSVVVVRISGSDTGELGDRPFRELAADLEAGPLELFIDGRETKGASIEVSGDWAVWLRKHRPRLRRVTMLTGSRFIEVTAEFVRRFAELEDTMRITTDPAAFDAALAAAVQGERAG